MSNYFRTALLLAALTAIFMVGGFLLAGPQGIVIALVVAAAINLFAWWNSGSAVLRYYQARELNDPTHPLYRIVAQLADRDGLPMPRVYIIDNPQPNAGLLGTIAMMILAPLAAMLVQMAISRNREYQADREGALICGDPEWLASALEKLEAGTRRIDNQAAEHNPATAHMFIVNPLHAHKHDSLFSTHPNTANRVARLREMSGKGGNPSVLDPAVRGPWSRSGSQPANRPRGPWARN